MTDLAKLHRDYHAAFAGLTPEDLAAVDKLIKNNPDLKIMVPDPTSWI